MEKISDVFVLSKKETIRGWQHFLTKKVVEWTQIFKGEPICKPSDDVLNKIRVAASKDQIININ